MAEQVAIDAFGRAQRVPLPELPQGDITLQPPPVLPRGSGQAWLQMLFMLPMMLAMGGMSFAYVGRAGGPATWAFGGLYVVAMIGMLAMGFSRGGISKKAQINDERRDYLRYLGGLRSQVRKVGVQQRSALLASHPDPGDLWAIVAGRRLWERRPGDDDFLKVRVAAGPQRLATALKSPQTPPLEDLDPVASTSLRHFIRAYSTVGDLPVAVNLRSFARVTVHGDRPAALGVVRALLGQLASFHSPDQLRIACCLGPERHAEWEWVKWLPHAIHRREVDGAGPRRLCAGSLSALADMLEADLGERPAFGRSTEPGGALPHIVVVIDGSVKTDGRLAGHTGLAGVTLIELGGAPTPARKETLDLVIEDDRLGMATQEHVALVGAPDQLTEPAAATLARHMTGRYVGAPIRDEVPLTATFGLTDLLGLGDPRTVDPALTWQPRSPRDRLRIPIGVDSDGRHVELDLKESAEGGLGPHGLIIGATGSGKSELLRTLVTGLVVTHSSETLNLALIDFKGGATFAGMTDLPHTCAVITNLADDLALVDRMTDAIRGEVLRRQELLHAAGHFASVRDYERAREAGAALRPLPSLLVIIDEFSELLTERPDLIDLFVQIGRLGRSLGIHLLLASQRLDEGRLRGLDSHLSYRIGLRTFSASDSRAVLGVPDAYELPPTPGMAYLKYDTTTMVRFKTAYVSGDLPPPAGSGSADALPVHRRPVPFTLAAVPVAAPARSAEEPAAPKEPAAAATAVFGTTVMTTLLGNLIGKGPPAHQIWLPLLDEPPTLDQVLPPLVATEDRGLCPQGWTANGRLTVPVAIVDKPLEQRRDLQWANLSGAAGHAVVVGAPQSGKSNLLRTLVTGLALTHTPAEVQFFLLDFGGGTLATLAGLPHVSGSANRLDPDRVRRIIAELIVLMGEREKLFGERGIDSMATFRSSRPGQPEGRNFGDVFLVIDGWLAFRQEFERLEEPVVALAGQGLGYGIHVVLSANRWMEVRAAIRDLIGTRFELKIGDAIDSEVSRRAAQNVPQGRPGRGLTPDALHMLTALPRVDGRPTVPDLADGVADVTAKITSAWPGERAPQVRLLPRMIPYTALPAPAPNGDKRIPIGIAEADLGSVFVDFNTDPHLITFGDNESGKTGLLRLLARGIMDRYTPAEAAILVVDYRRTMLGVVPDEYLVGYAGAEPVLTKLTDDLSQIMKSRLPGPEVTAEQLRNRTWWTGPELFVLVDDYDLVVGGGRNPLTALLEVLPQARDIGLHIALTRRAGGAARALYEPVLQRLRDLSSPGLLLSCPKDEGVLLGDIKPSPQPPGRGHLISRRGGAMLVQVGWVPEEE